MRVYPPNKDTCLHHHRAVTDVLKGWILEARGLGLTHDEISVELDIPQSTVASFLHRFQERGSEENLRSTERPQKTSARFDRYLIRTALVDTNVSNTVLRNITNSGVSASTIRRRLREDHIRKWRAVKRASLTEEQAAKPLKWAREHFNCTQEYWERVFWSDECAVQKDSNGQILWVFRHQNKQGKYAPKNVRGWEKGGRLFQMIWRCFAGTKLGPIAFIEGTVNTDIYIALLQDNLVPFIDAIIADV